MYLPPSLFSPIDVQKLHGGLDNSVPGLRVRLPVTQKDAPPDFAASQGSRAPGEGRLGTELSKHFPGLDVHRGVVGVAIQGPVLDGEGTVKGNALDVQKLLEAGTPGEST